MLYASIEYFEVALTYGMKDWASHGTTSCSTLFVILVWYAWIGRPLTIQWQVLPSEVTFPIDSPDWSAGGYAASVMLGPRKKQRWTVSSMHSSPFPACRVHCVVDACRHHYVAFLTQSKRSRTR